MDRMTSYVRVFTYGETNSAAEVCAICLEQFVPHSTVR